MIAARRLRGLARCRAGATVVEFALVAPVFLMMLFGMIETARALWTRQTLEDVAFATARCMAVGSACADDAARRGFAVARARSFGIALSATTGVSAAAGACGSVTADRVVLTARFTSAASGLLPLPRTIQAVGCFPILS